MPSFKDVGKQRRLSGPCGLAKRSRLVVVRFGKEKRKGEKEKEEGSLGFGQGWSNGGLWMQGENRREREGRERRNGR